MAGANITNFGAQLKELYTLPPVRVLNDVSFLHDKMRKEAGTTDFSGKYITFPVTVQRNLGRGSRGDEGVLPSAGNELDLSAQVFMKRHYYALEWSEAVEVASKNKEGAFEGVVTRKMKNVAIDLAKDANRQHYNGSNGALATATADNSASTTVTLDTVQYIRPGDTLDIYSAGTIIATNGTANVVVSVNKTAKTLVLTSPLTFTASNVVEFFITGNRGNEVEGLRVICGTSRTLHGINSATAGYDEWDGNVLAAGGVVAGESLFEQLYDKIGERGRGDMDTYITTRGVRRALADEFASQRRYLNEKAVDIKAGYSAIEVNGKMCVIDDDCPKGYVFGLSLDTHKVLEAVKPGFLETEAGNGAYIELRNHTVAGQKVAIWQTWYRYHWSHCCTDPGRNGMITGALDT